MKKYEPKSLISRYTKGENTPEEKSLVEQGFLNDLQSSDHTPSRARIEEADKKIAANLMNHLGANQTQKQYIKIWPHIAIAGSILIFLSFGTYFLLRKDKFTRLTAKNHIHDIAPGTNKAILKMANGTQLVITNAKNGLLAQHGSIRIIKTADGKLVYSNIGTNGGMMLYDTLIVPRGGQHQVKFSDGSIAYLNSDSKLRIPENFEKSDRTVELITGEADFEVVHNTKSPFRVKVNGQITEDIGTEFNINAYPDEAIVKTTLLKGSIKVIGKSKSMILKPGQQADISSAFNAIKIYDVDTDEVFAWKNGKFIFSSTPLEEIMRQLSRWYDVDVVYEDESLRQKKFLAISTRFANASQVLHDLELTGAVKFKIDGKRIIVLNK